MNQKLVSAILIIIIVSDRMGDKTWWGTTSSIKCKGQYLCDTVKTGKNNHDNQPNIEIGEMTSQDDWE